jgi:hypothetical protein
MNDVIIDNDIYYNKLLFEAAKIKFKFYNEFQKNYEPNDFEIMSFIELEKMTLASSNNIIDELTSININEELTFTCYKVLYKDSPGKIKSIFDINDGSFFTYTYVPGTSYMVFAFVGGKIVVFNNEKFDINATAVARLICNGKKYIEALPLVGEGLLRIYLNKATDTIIN